MRVGAPLPERYGTAVIYNLRFGEFARLLARGTVFHLAERQMKLATIRARQRAKLPKSSIVNCKSSIPSGGCPRAGG